MRSFQLVAVLFLLSVFLSFQPGNGYKWWTICKVDKVSRPPFSCGQPRCDKYCSEQHPKPRGWGKCKDDDRYVCQCYYVCFRDGPPRNTGGSLAPSSSPAAPPTP